MMPHLAHRPAAMTPDTALQQMFDTLSAQCAITSADWEVIRAHLTVQQAPTKLGLLPMLPLESSKLVSMKQLHKVVMRQVFQPQPMPLRQMG